MGEGAVCLPLPGCYMLPLYVSRQSVHRLFVILAPGLMFQFGNCTGIVLNRHRADGLGVWAISGDDMHWKQLGQKRIDDSNFQPCLTNS